MVIQVKILILTLFVSLSSGYDWNAHKKNHGLTFSTMSEEIKRQTVFSQNMATIDEHNKKAESDKTISYKLGQNHLTHLTFEEVSAKCMGYAIKKNRGGRFESQRSERQITKSPVVAASGCSFTCAPETTTKPFIPVKATTPSNSATSIDWRGTPRVGPIKNQGSCG